MRATGARHPCGMDLDNVSAPIDSVTLVAVEDESLREEVRRIAAAADCPLQETRAEIDRLAWRRSPQIVLDIRSARSCVQERLPRRHGVVLVCAGDAGLADWQVAAAAGVDHVLGLPAQESELVEILGARPDSGIGDGSVVAVVGGRGGAGASTLAAAIALVADDGAVRPRTLLVDGDGFGGGIDLLLGLEDRDGLRWPGLVLEGGRLSSSALHGALPTAGKALAVLACGRGADATDPGRAAIGAVLDAGRTAGDLVVCDVPRRGLSDSAFIDGADLVVLVLPAEIRATAAAETLAAQIKERNPNQGLVVRGPAPGGLRADDIATALGLPLLAATRPEPRLTDRLERGGLRLRKRSPLRGAADAVLDVLAARPASGRWVA